MESDWQEAYDLIRSKLSGIQNEYGNGCLAFLSSAKTTNEENYLMSKLSNFPDSNIIMTLERYMQCGIGKCGHCNIGENFVCVDGPVYSYEEVKRMPENENVF